MESLKHAQLQLKYQIVVLKQTGWLRRLKFKIPKIGLPSCNDHKSTGLSKIEVRRDIFIDRGHSITQMMPH